MTRPRLVFTIALLLGPLVSPVAAEAQEAAKVARIGYLAADLAAGLHLQEAFLQGMRDLGYVEGRNLVIEYRHDSRDGCKTEIHHWSVPAESLDASADMIRILETQFCVTFERVDMADVRTFEEFEARGRQIGWEIS